MTIETTTTTEQDAVIEDLLDNIDIYPEYDVLDILEEHNISLNTFKIAYDREYG